MGGSCSNTKELESIKTNKRKNLASNSNSQSKKSIQT